MGALSAAHNRLRVDWSPATAPLAFGGDSSPKARMVRLQFSIELCLEEQGAPSGFEFVGVQRIAI